MFTLKISEDDHFKNIDEAIQYMKNTNFERDVSVYDIDSKKAFMKTKEIYNFITEYNKGKPLDDQILPTNPFGFRGIIGCLGVTCYSISTGTYKENHKCIAPFTGYNDSVLDTSVEKADISPSFKALTSLAMLSTFHH